MGRQSPDRQCSGCKRMLPYFEFRWFPIAERWSKRCAECRARGAKNWRAWAERNPELAHERTRESHEVIRDLRLEYQREYDTRNREQINTRKRARHKQRKEQQQ